MKIALDTNPLFTNQAGTARYVDGLLLGMRQLGRTDIDIHPLAWPVPNFNYQQPQRAAKTVYREFLWTALSAPRQLRAMKPDVLHVTSPFDIPCPGTIRKVITLYDLAILTHPYRYRPWQCWAGRIRLRMLHNADRVICISQFTADEAMRLIGLPAAKIDIVHLGTSLTPDTIPTPPATPTASLPDAFFLVVGSLEPGKNLRLLRQVYQLAEEQGRPLPPLAIAGKRWLGVEHEGPPPANWIYLDRVDDNRLIALYKKALALVFPSKYEGFGLPVVEAMALGCPVLCTPVASMPEVGGDAVLYAQPTPEAYLTELQQLANSPALRQDLANAGKTRSREFTWQACAAKTLAVYSATIR